mgnify:CR=1 FL=1
MRVTARGSLLLLAGLAVAASPALSRPPSADDLRGAEIRISRASAPIEVDGDLGDAGWAGAPRIETFYETNPGDNVTPRVRTVARLAYDDRFLYVGLECDDPEPRKVRAPYAERDRVNSDTDYAGIILDTRNDGRTAILFLANPRGIQYDAVTDDGNEDSSPDFFWDSSGRIGPAGWTLEIRIPFSSLRYERKDPQTWGILVYRNYPRDYRYQMFSARLPRGRNCFVCSENVLSGLEGLPPGGHLVAAPYVTGSLERTPREAPAAGSETSPADGEAGLDVKWTPFAGTAVDATVNPDFSQVESDTAQIGVNERFALFYPEKRPFFLEGVDLFSTPINAVYTRTITSPRWGLRGTGKLGATAWTLLAADDRGGGSVVLPGPDGSSFADQDFHSTAFIGRVRHDVGRSFGSFLVADREIAGGAYNRVLGPDAQWRPTEQDTVSGQLLWSRSATPDRPDLASEWNGQTLSGHALKAWWSHSTDTIDWFGMYKDLGNEFRADLGFVPQVGLREGYGEAGWTFRPEGFFRRIRTFVEGGYQEDRDGLLLEQYVNVGAGADGGANSFLRLWYQAGKVRAGDGPIPRQRLAFIVQAVPSRVFGRFSLEGDWGEQIDYVGARQGRGGQAALTDVIRPTDHLALDLTGQFRWLDVTPEDGGGRKRLFTAYVGRLKATWTFNARSFLRLIGQYVGTRYDPSLYPDPGSVPERDGAFSASALFAWKLNWQSVVYLGYGDSRNLSTEGGLPPGTRQLFLKVSYAFQR